MELEKEKGLIIEINDFSVKRDTGDRILSLKIKATFQNQCLLLLRASEWFRKDSSRCRPEDTKIQTVINRNGKRVQLNFGGHICVQFRATACLF